LKDGVPVQTTWADIQVGDLMLVKENESFPADLVVLSTYFESGVCFIETSSLDGEKNLKPKSAIGDTLEFYHIDRITAEPISLDAGKPNQALYEYEGSLTLNSRRILLNSKQLLLRGAYLRNTKWIVGAVIYTGEDTKIMRNAEPARNKTSRIEETMNKYIIGIFVIQIALCGIMAGLSYIWLSRHAQNAFYLDYSDNMSPVGDSLLIIFTYFLLLNTMIPISLIVSLEFVKLF
jgi:phospholipid-transporting ATPase